MLFLVRRTKLPAQMIDAEIDEVERIADFVGNAAGKLAESGKMLGGTQLLFHGSAFAQLVDHIIEAFGKLAYFIP